MIETLKRNIETEIEILREISIYQNQIDLARPNEKYLIDKTIRSLGNSLKIINNSIPEILKDISGVKKLNPSKSVGNLENIRISRNERKFELAISGRERDNLFKELSISEGLIKRLKKREKDEEEYVEFKAARGYIKLSNRFFFKLSNRLVKKGNFTSLRSEIRKANLDVLLPSYVAMIFFTSFLSIFVGIGLFMFLLFFNIGFIFPFIEIFQGDLLLRIFQTFWIPLALPIATFVFLYIYPSLEKQSIAYRIDQELPFAVIHMSAISGSGIPPTKIFKIIGTSRDYPALRKEIRKILNQVNLYGYDLVTALNELSKSTPSKRLAELLGGLSTTIHSGGSLKEFFEKRSETLMLDYRLEREKYAKSAETFMDIYISVVIAAPMILMLLLVMISVSGIGLGLTTGQVTLLIVLGLSLINIVFLGFLHFKQPTY
jgi:flagellar protein FlaJ